MLYLNCISHKLCYIFSDPTFWRDWVEIIVNIITGVILISGIRYLKPLKEKTISSTFNFWAQLNIHLNQISLYLENNVELLDNLYSVKVRQSWDKLSEQTERLEDFKRVIISTVDFLKSTPDQMPAYEGWSSDYHKLIQYFNEMIIFDICDGNNHFKFDNDETITDREDFRNDICKLIGEICTGISEKQKKVEKNLFRRCIFKREKKK